MKNHSIQGLIAGIFISLVLSGCNIFNISIPDYIDRYTNTAAAGAHEFDGTLLPRQAGNNNNLMIAEPHEPFSINVTLRNPRNYSLQPLLKIFGSTGTWEDYSSVDLETAFKPQDHVKIGFNNSWPESTEVMRLRINLMDIDSGRTFENEDYELPQLFWAYTARGPLNIRSLGRNISWTEADNEGATKMSISWQSGSSGGHYTYSRAARLTDWAADNVSYPPVVKDVSAPDFSVDLPGGASGIPVGASYAVSITFSDEYSLTENRSVNGAAPFVIYASNAGTGTGENASDPIAFKDIDLQSITGAIEIFLTGDVTVGDIGSTGPTVIPGKVSSMTIKPYGGDREIGLENTGSLFTVNNGASLVLKGDSGNSLTLKGYTSNNKSLITVDSGGSMEMYDDVIIKDNFCNDHTIYGGGINAAGDFTMYGGTISNNQSGYGGGVYATGSLSIHGGVINTNKALSYGGGVYAAGNMTIHGGTIFANQATYYSGGVYAAGNFTMHGGTINNNISGSQGGGVYASGTFTMNDGTIDNNNAYTSGGVHLAKTGTFNMNDGIIKNNKATSEGGGVQSQGIFIMNGGSISGNRVTSYAGGGVYITSSGAFTMNDGIIDNNKAGTSGGGVNSSGTFIMYGGFISNNNVTSSPYGHGGGVYSSKTFTMHGGTINYNETAVNGGGVYIEGGTFTMNDGTIGDNKAASYGGGVCSDGTFNMYGGTISNNKADDGGGGICVGNDKTFTMHGGTIRDNQAVIGGGVHTFGVSIINGGTISGNKASNHGGGVCTANGTFAMNGGFISRNSATNHGGGISFNSSAYSTITIENSIFQNNTAGTSGGAVFFGSGTKDSIITNCTFWENSAGYGGAIHFYSGLNSAIINCTITGNYAIGYGGGIDINSGSLNIYGSIIIGNIMYGGTRNEVVGTYTDIDSLVSTTIDPTDIFTDTAPVNNGGPTMTIMIDKFNPNICLSAKPSWSGATVPDTDQRGYTRTDLEFYFGAVDPDGTEP